MNIAKALKEKNRIAANLAKTRAEILAYNSQPDAAADKVDIQQAFAKHETLTNNLVKVKSEISKANVKIQEKIYLLAEYKGQMSWLQGLDTTHGLVSDRCSYRTDAKEVLYSATIRKADKDAKIADLQLKIDRLQDELDEFNAATKINIEDFLS